MMTEEVAKIGQIKHTPDHDWLEEKIRRKDLLKYAVQEVLLGHTEQISTQINQTINSTLAEGQFDLQIKGVVKQELSAIIWQAYKGAIEAVMYSDDMQEMIKRKVTEWVMQLLGDNEVKGP